MVQFPSKAWFEDLAVTSARLTISSNPPLVVQQIITDAAGDDIASWHMRIAEVVSVALGEVASPTITLTSDRETAIALASGRLNAQAAISGGRLRVSGDIAALVQVTPALLEVVAKTDS